MTYQIKTFEVFYNSGDGKRDDGALDGGKKHRQQERNY
jgi:hypothetical protein